ncbi:hypothetical protein [Paenibacillus sp. JMULE4]|uniref:ABC transporter ATP-binding protein C-terminal domain-containing protein n=1 Tax=Paenibacillus sp. JMULE4 TaxID=2518342 RepID=UPI0020C73E4F|nr:hypothetical protein [Paenibacillus sp. JMULE4]
MTCSWFRKWPITLRYWTSVKKISEGSVEQVLNDPEVIKAYLGEEFVRAET